MRAGKVSKMVNSRKPTLPGVPKSEDRTPGACYST